GRGELCVSSPRCPHLPRRLRIRSRRSMSLRGRLGRVSSRQRLASLDSRRCPSASSDGFRRAESHPGMNVPQTLAQLSAPYPSLFILGAELRDGARSRDGIHPCYPLAFRQMEGCYVLAVPTNRNRVEAINSRVRSLDFLNE